MWPGVVSGLGGSVGDQMYMGFRGLGCKIKVLGLRNMKNQMEQTMNNKWTLELYETKRRCAERHNYNSVVVALLHISRGNSARRPNPGRTSGLT